MTDRPPDAPGCPEGDDTPTDPEHLADPAKTNPPVSCGVLFRQALQHAHRTLDSNTDTDLWFTVGFCVGQIEKVYLGACPMAMFPCTMSETPPVLATAIHISAKVYGLAVHEILYDTPEGVPQTELWVYNPTSRLLPDILHPVKPDSPDFHILRGLLCGIPSNRLNPHWNPER